ncbi:hypothetical protein [Lacticaseibacillus jixiensis]|uniref:hypothetical protein n=1 Tax=Lacticaseibacillus jixiensis TaxID=3231926 RepID=UPI0036F3FC6B
MKKIVIALALFGLASSTAACSNKPATSSSSSAKSSKVAKTKPKAAASASKTASSSASSAAKPTRQPNAIEKIALVLLTPGAEQYSMAGSRLLAAGDQDIATLGGGGLVDGAPAGTVVYGLSLERDNKTPFVTIVGDLAYLFATQSPVPYDYLSKHALKVDLKEAWQKNFQSADLAKLCKQITLGSDQQADDAAAAQSTSDASADSTTVDVKNLTTAQMINWVKADLINQGADAAALEDPNQVKLDSQFKDGYAEVLVYTWNGTHTFQTLGNMYRVNESGQLQVSAGGDWSDTGTPYPQ